MTIQSVSTLQCLLEPLLAHQSLRRIEWRDSSSVAWPASYVVPDLTSCNSRPLKGDAGSKTNRLLRFLYISRGDILYIEMVLLSNSCLACRRNLWQWFCRQQFEVRRQVGKRLTGRIWSINSMNSWPYAICLCFKATDIVTLTALPTSLVNWVTVTRHIVQEKLGTGGVSETFESKGGSYFNTHTFSAR